MRKKVEEGKVAQPKSARELLREKTVSAYLEEMGKTYGETARSQRFTALLQQLLGVAPDFIGDYCKGFETHLRIKQDDRILRGRADNLFENVVIEFEHAIPAKLEDAKEQLRRYVAILWLQETQDERRPYLCVATDGVRFITFTPSLANPRAAQIEPDDVHLETLEKSDWSSLDPDIRSEEIYFWLDRHFSRKEKNRIPTTEAIEADFGMNSHAFQSSKSQLMAVWTSLKRESEYQVIYKNWDKYLRIVYGSEVGGDELFIRHTYMATVAKVMAWRRIGETTTLPSKGEVVDLLEGRLFRSKGIENFIEEDFFSWLSKEGAISHGIEIVRRLFSLFQNYNLNKLSEDVLKSLYQELVDPKTRHDLGEFYTPDWLAHRIVRQLLDANPQASLLDPACGSGTFIYLAVREKRARLGNSQKTLYHILDSVYGIDIHPLAVIVTKTNYVLALGDLVGKRGKGTLSIPVNLADAIKLPEAKFRPNNDGHQNGLQFPAGAYEITLDEERVDLREQLFRDPRLYDHAIELCKDFLKTSEFPMAGNEPVERDLYNLAMKLKAAINKNRDSIWAFILKNSYKPLFLRDKFDFVAGNPPWLSFRFMEPAYQRFVKAQVVNDYRLAKGSAHLVTHLDVATLFLVRAADLYLKSGGTVAFVLPRSIFTADEHDRLRKGEFMLSEHPGLDLYFHEVWDCEKVKPLFNVPSCVLIAEKRKNGKSIYPIKGKALSGTLSKKNASLDEAEEKLATKDVEYSLHMRGKRSYWAVEEQTDNGEESYYRRSFFEGATIVPRSFWFVKVESSSLGIDPARPFVETADRAIREAKAPYKDVRFRSQMYERFIYATLLSTDLLPFGYLDYRMLVLPIEPENDHYRMVDKSEAKNRGMVDLWRWLEKAEKDWEECRGSKAKDVDLLGWLDYRKKLTRQNPQTKYRVIYNTSGTYLTAAVVKNEPIEFKIGFQKIEAMGFIADYITYYFETSNRQEACYLSAVLNSPQVDLLVKPMQARGLWGARHLCKKVLELPITKFDRDNLSHKRLTSLGADCASAVEDWVSSGEQGKITSIGKLRSMVREMLRPKLDEIDALVKGLLKF